MIITGCASSLPSTPTEAIQEDWSSPLVIQPSNGSEFVNSDVELSWDWSGLEANQHYVLQLWFEDETPQEVWTQDTAIQVNELIDSYSQDVGSYYWKVAVVTVNEAGSFDSMASEWSDVQELHRVRRLSLTPQPPAEMSATAQFILAQNLSSASEIIDFTQTWMFENTHIGAELDIYEPDYSDAADAMLQHYQSDGDAPQMYCNGISTTMLTILRELGIESRMIFLYGEVDGWINQHTVLEVFNPDTQNWQVHDPTFNLYYEDIETQVPVSIERMVFGTQDTIQGCIEGDCNSDDNIEHIASVLGAFRYGFSFEVWVNPDRLNVSRRVSAFENQNFPEFIASISGTESPNITIRFDSWEN